MYMKRPTKAELYKRLKAQELENIKLSEEIEAVKIREWEKKLPDAIVQLKTVLFGVFGPLVTLIRYEHVDASGYWFTFELSNNSTRQRYRINHNEI